MSFDIAALKNQTSGLARGGVWFAVGWVVGKGYIDGDTAVAFGGAAIGVLGIGLTSVANTNSSITSAFSQIPTTKKIETSDPVLAEVAKSADPSTEVKIVKETP